MRLPYFHVFFFILQYGWFWIVIIFYSNCNNFLFKIANTVRGLKKLFVFIFSGIDRTHIGSLHIPACCYITSRFRIWANDGCTSIVYIFFMESARPSGPIGCEWSFLHMPCADQCDVRFSFPACSHSLKNTPWSP